MTTGKMLLVSCLLPTATIFGWVNPVGRAIFANHLRTAQTGLWMFSDEVSTSEIPMSREMETFDDPCWQNMLDDDCSMGNIYAANFVASKWIQSMPCGEGIEDCDMPAQLTSPDACPEAGVDLVDVMKVLGLKRAESINAKGSGKGGPQP